MNFIKEFFFLSFFFNYIDLFYIYKEKISVAYICAHINIYVLLILYSLNVNRENDHDLKLFLTVCKSCINIDVLIFDQKKKKYIKQKNIHKKH